ncbi:MAG TPA: phosphoribosylformylglycinamidine cyclo-ligase [Candidatus Kapabacteria bacterium]|jgi:phosphoribosylformylglycinamidine cyclo-ligase|nr:phosphoribosylformylglycinamidine cyclo-ligase [Candidatus Kapabacteria bacterium]
MAAMIEEVREQQEQGLTYKTAGVNIDAGEELVRRIKPLVRRTFNDRVLTDIGGFGGLFDARFPGMQFPVLVSSTDGVGTKIKVAIEANKHDTVGQDLVNHCVNDILVCGARPLFFLDYFASGKLNVDEGEAVISGFVKACEENECALIGGETAEMPSMYAANDYDLAGTIVGIVERDRMFRRENVAEGDVLIGLPSTGLHTNGFSLARKALFAKYNLDDSPAMLDGNTISDALLKIHRSYLHPVSRLLETFEPSRDIHALSHITGGGIIGNTSRVLPEGLVLSIDWDAWERPPIFRLIQEAGMVPEDDMRRTFNLGIGLILIVPNETSVAVEDALRECGEQPIRMGRVVRK